MPGASRASDSILETSEHSAADLKYYKLGHLKSFCNSQLHFKILYSKDQAPCPLGIHFIDFVDVSNLLNEHARCNPTSNYACRKTPTSTASHDSGIGFGAFSDT